MLLSLSGTAFGQSFTKTEYTNDITGITHTTIVVDQVNSQRIRRKTNVVANNFTNTGVSASTTLAAAETELKIAKGLAQMNKSLKFEFVGIVVIKMHPEINDSVTEVWETVNYCTYKVNSDRSKITFKEHTPKGSLVKSWSYDIVAFDDDDLTYIAKCEVDDKGSWIDIILWKDKSMVALKGADATYLVSGHFKSAK